MSAEIHIHGPYAVLKGEYSLAPVLLATSYLVQGYQFSKAYRKKVWDGRKHLFNKRTGSFPTGLLSAVKEAVESSGTSVEIVDHRVVPTPKGGSFILEGASFDYPYDYQLDVCKKMVEAKQGVVKLATNGGKTSIACAVTQYLGLRTLFIVASRELMYQARDRFMRLLKMSEAEIGVVGDGVWEPGSLVTIGIVNTLESRIDDPECRELLESCDVLFADECHKVGSQTFFTVLAMCSAYYRWGLSGTPMDRTDGANLNLIGAAGDLIVDIPNKFLVERGVSAKASIIFDKVTEPVLEKKLRYPSAYKQGISENPHLLAKVIEWTKTFHTAGISTLILCEEIAHGHMIDEALWTQSDVLIPHQFIHGTEDGETRAKALKDFSDRSIPVLIASSILDEGIDCPSIDALILAGSRKSRIKTMQRLGRGLRGKQLIVVEFANFCHKFLLEHSLQRYEDYVEEDCFDIHNSGPDLDLVKSLWKVDAS